MQQFSVSPKEMVAGMWRNRYLIKKSIQREVVGRYRGSLFGILWSFFNPVFMLSVYTFVFSVVVIAFTVLFGTPHITILLLPIIILPLLFFIAGISWGLASLRVNLRDVSCQIPQTAYS